MSTISKDYQAKLRAELLTDLENLTDLIKGNYLPPSHLRGWADMLANDIAKTLRAYADEVEKGGKES